MSTTAAPKSVHDRDAILDKLDLTPDSLVGSFFDSFKVREDGKRVISWQGRVVAEPHSGYYLVEMYDWVVGSPYSQQLVNIAEMLDWRFYDTAEWINNAYEDDPGPQERRAERERREEEWAARRREAREEAA